MFLTYSCEYIELYAKDVLSRKTGQTDYKISNELMNGFRHYVEGNVGMIINEVSYANFVEYGTGVKGRNNPHPQADLEGWAYLKESGWLYWDEKHSEFRYTHGLPAYRFFYDAVVQYETLGIKKCFDRAFKEVIGAG